MLNFLYNLFIFPLTQIIEFSFVFSQKIFKETGISLIFISLVISVLCLPLYNVAEKWQEVERCTQKKMKAKMDKIRAVFSGDERYMITSIYYRQNHYHPVYALRSSFGLLIQIPFFIAAYTYLSNLEAVKGAHFFFISDLGLPDSLIQTGNTKVNFLPILMTLLNLAAGVIYTKGFPLKEKIKLAAMALFFLVILYNSPSALVIYWTMNNFFSLVKNLYYKIQFPYKNAILFMLFSVICILFVYYILFFHKGDIRQRSFIAAATGFMAALPWVSYLIKRIKSRQGNENQQTRSRSELPIRRGIKPRFSLFAQSYFRKRGLTSSVNKFFLVFVLSFLALCLLLGLFIPSMLIVSSSGEFSFIDDYTTPLFFVFNTFTQSLGFFLLWPLALYFLFSTKTRYGLSCFALILCTCAIINTFLFSGNYGLVSINMQLSNGVNHDFRMTLLNLLSLGISTLLCGIFFHLRLYKVLIPILSFCVVALLGISLFNIFGIQKDFTDFSSFYAKTTETTTLSKHLFSLSRKGKNTVIIMLDRASSSFFPYILKESPELKKIYSGFTYYPNTVSFNGYTMIGAPPVFGGYEYTPEEINRRDEIPLRIKHNEALLLLPRLFSEAGYSVTVTDPPYPNYSMNQDFSIYDNYPGVKVCISDGLYTNSWLEEHDIKLPSLSAILKRNIFWYGLLRISPLTIRRGLYQYGDWCSSVAGQNLRVFLNGYAVLDKLACLSKITNDNGNNFLLMVNNTTHDGTLLQEPDYRPVINVASYFSGPYNKETEYHINIAAYKRLAEWFNHLKTQGVYDNTRIIIVSDHGSQINYVLKPSPSMPSNIDNFHPILLVKDFNTSGELKTDTVFMTNADVPFLALNGQIENPINPFTNKPISIMNKEKPLYIAVSGSVHLEDPLRTTLSLDPKNDYYVHGGFFEEKNWSRAEQ